MPSGADRPALILHGMHGLGDNLHQRAVVRELLKTRQVWIFTAWPQLYWDLDAHPLPLGSPLRWMAANETRMADLYGPGLPAGAPSVACRYPVGDVKQTGSVLGAMSRCCGVPLGDFRLPVAPAWAALADALWAQWKPAKPVLIYRPLVVRVESRIGYAARNPDHAAYHALISAIRDRYFVVSIADLMPGKEWLVGPQIEADATYHAGELNVEAIAAITARAALVFCSPGFMIVMAQAVGTPVVCTFGGFECADSFSAGARFTPTLSIEPRIPCNCWDHGCMHSKQIDMPRALARLNAFILDPTCKSS